jgi:hypothetical protein
MALNLYSLLRRKKGTLTIIIFLEIVTVIITEAELADDIGAANVIVI